MDNALLIQTSFVAVVDLVEGKVPTGRSNRKIQETAKRERERERE